MHMPSHPVHTAANCSHLQLSTLQQSLHIQCTLQQILSAPPVHTYCSSHYIFSVHCSKSSVHLQCTHTAAVITSSVYTAANLQCTSSAHTLQQSLHLQCTLQPHYLVPILYSTFSAPLNHHKVSLYHYWPTSRTVSRH